MGPKRRHLSGDKSVSTSPRGAAPAPPTCCRGFPCPGCWGNASLWNDLALGEVTVPSLVINILQSGVPREDVVEPLSVPDSRDRERAMLRVRTHWNGAALVQTYDQCTAEGLVVWCCDGGLQPDSIESYSGWLVMASGAALSSADCKRNRPEAGVLFLTAVEALKKSRLALMTISLVVSERRCGPTSLPSPFDADRRLGLFCDVTLCVDGQDFPAHKVVLASASDVFRAMFTADFKEKSAARVDIGGTTAKAFGKFLDFLYADDDGYSDWRGCEIELLELADLYQVHRLKRLCEGYLWQLRGRDALDALLGAERLPVLAPAVHSRLCRQAVGLQGEDDWGVLQNEAPFAAGAISGLVAASDVSGHLVQSLEYLPALRTRESSREASHAPAVEKHAPSS